MTTLNDFKAPASVPAEVQKSLFPVLSDPDAARKRMVELQQRKV